MTKDSGLQVSSRRLIRERVGLIVNGTNAAAAIKTIAAAEAAGVQQIWMTNIPWSPDVLTTFAAAAIKTSRIRLGTSILPTYPRHPVVLAQQVLALHDIAQGRLRLGIGPSHRAVIEDIYGLPQTKPLVHLREYVKVLHSIFWDGKVDHHGEFFNIVIEFPRKVQIPVLISTLGKRHLNWLEKLLMELFHGCVLFHIYFVQGFRYYIKQLLLMDAQTLLHW